MNNDFKSFLKGLLNKAPQERLGWPDLLKHPFIRETEAEAAHRESRTERYLKWIELEHPDALKTLVGKENAAARVKTPMIKVDKQKVEADRKKTRQTSKGEAPDMWNKYE